MADANPGDPNRLHPAPRPLTPLWVRRWVGFPAAPLPLIGRDREIAAVCDLLLHPGRRIVTVTGPGGVGKTRLAFAVAEALATEFTDGGAFVALAAISDPALVLSAIARVLEVRETPGRSPRETLIGVLRERHLLLVLDNVEHLAGHAAVADISALLEACPALTVLVTSRTPLRLHDEQRFATPALALPRTAAGTDPATLAGYGAIALFIDRARMVRQEFLLTAENAAAVAEICRRLDGLPLAIELAAAWVRVLPPAALLARLEPRLPLLRGGAADQPNRLRTMRDAIAWSYDLLRDEEQRFFRRLAVFVGGFTLEGAERVGGGGLKPSGGGAALRGRRPSGPQGGEETGRTLDQAPASPPATVHPLNEVTPPAAQPPPPEAARPAPPVRSDPPSVLDLVASLLDKSLLLQTEASGAEPRFAMLETVREFALEQLAASGEAEAIAARHAAWCVDLAEQARRSGSLSHGSGLATLEAAHPNMRAALTWLLDHGETTVALHLTGQLAEFWLRHGHWTEGQGWLERALAADDGGPTAARVDALVGLTMLLWPREQFARAEQTLGEAEAVALAAGDAGAMAYVRLHQGYVALFQGDFDLAEAHGAEALATCEAIPQGFSRNGSLWLLARTALAREEDERASELHERLLASARAGGDEISIANGLYGLAVLAERRGEPREALAGFAEAAAVCRGFGDRLHATLCLDEVAVAEVDLARPEQAARLFAAADALRVAAGSVPVPRFMADRDRYARAQATARDVLGEARYAAAWAAGGALSLDEAVAEAATLARDVTQSALSDPSGPARLTERERQILPLLIDGCSDREIAEALFISQRTVSNHVSAILHKLEVGTRAEAAVRAVRDGLV